MSKAKPFTVEFHHVDDAHYIDDVFFDLPTLHDAKTKVMEWAEKKTGGDRYFIFPAAGGTAGKIKYHDRLIGFYFIYDEREK